MKENKNAEIEIQLSLALRVAYRSEKIKDWKNKSIRLTSFVFGRLNLEAKNKRETHFGFFFLSGVVSIQITGFPMPIKQKSATQTDPIELIG